MARFFRSLFGGVLWFTAFMAIVGGCLFGARALLDDQALAESPETRPLPVAVFEAVHQDVYLEKRRVAGRIVPAQIADAAFPFGGEVEAVFVEIGDTVKAGQPLARLDLTRRALAAKQAAAVFQEAEAARKQAEARYLRIESLFGQGYATRQEFEDAEAAREAARQRSEALRRARAGAQEDLEDVVLAAPFDGFVVGRYADAGAVVSAGQAVIRLNEKAAMEAVVGLPAGLAGSLAPGETYALERSGLAATARLLGIGEAIDPATRTRTARFAIEEDPGFIPGDLIRLDLARMRKGRGAWVPLAALVEGYRGLWSVFVVVDENGQSVVRRKDIEISSLGEERAYVTGTLEEGDLVVASSPFRLVPGQKVTIADQAAPPVSAVELAAAASGVVQP